MAIPDSDYLEAFKTAGQRLQECMDAADATFVWMKRLPAKPAFADLVFACGQRLYAVLLVAMTSQKQEGDGSRASFEIPREQRELLMEECERHRMEPVAFPLWLGIMQPLMTGWNLFSLKTLEQVVPGGESEAPPTPMSDWELCNFCVGQVMQTMEDEGLRLFSCQDIPGIYPNLWFRDAKDNRAWVAVLPSFGVTPGGIPREVSDLRRKLPEVSGYVARVAVTSDARPGAHPLRGEMLRLHYEGLEKLP